MRTTSAQTRPGLARAVALALAGLAASGCIANLFGKSEGERSYFVLNTKSNIDYGTRPIKGLVRVRTLHADAVYEKFQVAVRRNPYELMYDENHIWVAKPKRMISDLIAQSLKESERFTGVTRELGEHRPDYNLSGNLHAIEVFDSGDTWFSHLSISLQLSRYDTGEALYAMKFDERRQLAQRSFALAARALSELLSAAVEKMMRDLDEVESLYESRRPAGYPIADTDSDDDGEGAGAPARAPDELTDDSGDGSDADAADAAALPGDGDEASAAEGEGVILVPESPR